MSPDLSFASFPQRFKVGFARLSRAFASMRSVFVSSIFALLLAACEPPTLETPARFGSSRWPGFEPFFTAERAGMYAPGAVHLIETPASMTILKALRGTALDAAALSLSRVMTYVEDGVDLTIVLMVDRSYGSDALVARPDILTVQDLRGRRIGAEVGAVNGYLLMRALQQNNVPFDAVTIVDILNDDLPQAYRTGQVDAVSTFAWGMDTVIAEGGRPIFTSKDISGEIIDVLAVRTSYLRAHPDQISELIYGWMKGRDLIEHAREHDPTTLQTGLVTSERFWSSVENIPLATIEENVAVLADDAALLKDRIAKRRAISAQLNLLDPDAPLPKVDTAPFEAAYARWQREQEGRR